MFSAGIIFDKFAIISPSLTPALYMFSELLPFRFSVYTRGATCAAILASTSGSTTVFSPVVSAVIPLSCLSIALSSSPVSFPD